MRVAIAINDGVTDSGLAIALDVLRAANRIAGHLGRRPAFSLRVCSHDGRPVRAASGLRLGDLGSFAEAARAEALFVPGTWMELEPEVERWLEGPAFGRLARVVERARARGARVLGSCSGTFALAGAGILDGLEATTTWWLTRLFSRAFPHVRLDASKALIAHEAIATAGAVFAQADLSLHLVRTTVGPEVASLVTRYLLLDEHPGQAAYMAMSQLASDDALLRDAERWIRARLPEAIDVVALARAIGTSPRTLARRARVALGTSPGRWVRRLRVDEAARLLETTGLPMDRVAERVGFGSTATLRREVQSTLKMSPREVRARGRGRLAL